jgi:plasmid stabilization system protein ParE
MRRYAIDRHPLVRNDLFEIARFIGEYSGYSLADKKVDEIERSIAGLEELPHIGTVRSDILPGLRAIPSAEKAVVCFTVNDETHTVKIICITYAGQDWQTIARQREA